MKITFFAFLILSITALGQKPCEFSVNVKDSLGQYKSTKEYLLYEKVFAGNASYIFASIILADGMPSLNIQLIEKSPDFIKARCFDKNSRIYFQLANGVIVTVIHTDEESCGTMVRDDKSLNNRVTSGFFLFRKNDYESLKASPVSFIRIKFMSETADYVFRKSFTSELNGISYDPENYFVDYFHCMQDNN